MIIWKNVEMMLGNEDGNDGVKGLLMMGLVRKEREKDGGDGEGGR